MKIYTTIKKLAPICAVFAALAFTSCNDEPAEDGGGDTPAVEDGKGAEGKGATKGTE